MSNGVYFLVKLNNREKLLPTGQALSNSRDVIQWNAVDGHYNLILKLKEHNQSIIEQIRKLENTAEISICKLSADNEKELTLENEMFYSYIFIETEKNIQNSIYDILNHIENVVCCSPVTGCFNFIAMVKGKTFNDIDRTIDNDIRNLDGVLRLKQSRIITLDRM